MQAIVIGAGPAGLSVGYHLARYGVCFVILEARSRIGDVWRDRWDSLRLSTPARWNGLAGMPFPADRRCCPTKDQMADYLEQYAAGCDLRIHRGIRVDRVLRECDKYVVTSSHGQFEAEHVVVAMGSHQRPRIPAMAYQIDEGLIQLHSSTYRNPGQLRDGAVLVIGAGHAGVEIATELVRAGYRTLLSGRDTEHVAEPGIERVPRTVRVCDGLPALANGQRPDVTNIIWCTGFESGLSWPAEPGLYELCPSKIRDIDRDAARIARTIAKCVGLIRVPSGSPALRSAWW